MIYGSVSGECEIDNDEVVFGPSLREAAQVQVENEEAGLQAGTSGDSQEVRQSIMSIFMGAFVSKYFVFKGSESIKYTVSIMRLS